MSFTNYLETEILDHVFGGNAYTAPGTHYLALYTAAPGETGGGTECTGTSYARQTVAFTVSGNEATTARLSSFQLPATTGVRSHT